jgi:hypothetical protein
LYIDKKVDIVLKNGILDCICKVIKTYFHVENDNFMIKNNLNFKFVYDLEMVTIRILSNILCGNKTQIMKVFQYENNIIIELLLKLLDITNKNINNNDISDEKTILDLKKYELILVCFIRMFYFGLSGRFDGFSIFFFLAF